jgi:hypothetical protein
MKICRTWDEVNIRQFIELSRLKEDEDVINYYMKVVSILSGKPFAEVEAMNITELKSALKLVKFVDELPSNSLIPTRIKLNGNTYDVQLRVDLLKGGQYIDLKTYTKNEQSIIDNMHNIIALFLQPMRKRFWWYVPQKYDVAQMQEAAADVLNHMSVGDAYPMAVFFWNLLLNLTDATHEYISKETMKEIKILSHQAQRVERRKHFTNIGDGLRY